MAKFLCQYNIKDMPADRKITVSIDGHPPVDAAVAEIRSSLAASHGVGSDLITIINIEAIDYTPQSNPALVTNRVVPEITQSETSMVTSPTVLVEGSIEPVSETKPAIKVQPELDPIDGPTDPVTENASEPIVPQPTPEVAVETTETTVPPQVTEVAAEESPRPAKSTPKK